jgi:spore germination protein
MINSTGCWDQKIYENSGFVLQVSFETSKQGKLLMSFITPVVDPNAKDFTEFFYDKANLVREFREKARRVSDKLLEGGKIQQVLISDSLAQKGINNLLEVVEREPTDPPIASVVIVEGSPIKLMEAAKQFTDKPPRPAFYVLKLIRNNIESGYIPETRIYQFSTAYFAPGIDPIAPMIKLRTYDGKGIEVTGSALFKGDKMAGKIDTQKTSLLLAMMGKLKKTTYISNKIPETPSENGKEGCAVGITKVKRKLSVKMLDHLPVANISLVFNGVISEVNWNILQDESTQKSIEDKLSSEIKENCEEILKYTQQVGSDPLGIGDIVRAKYNNDWENADWDTAYSDVIFHVTVKVNISNHGAIR